MHVTFWVRRVLVPHCLLYVRAAYFSSRGDLGHSLTHVGKVCDTLLETSGNAEVSRFDVAAGFFDIRGAGTEMRTPPDCAIALETKRNDTVAQIDKIFSI